MNTPSRIERLRTLATHPLILSIYLPSTLFAFAQSLLIPILPFFVRDFKVSYGMVGLVLAGEALGTLLSDVPAGILLRRLGEKGAMLLGMVCIILATTSLFWARSVLVVLLLRLSSGFGVALFSVARHAFIADSIRVAGRGRAIALFGGANRIGKFLAPAIGGIVARAYGLRATFLLFGAVCAGTLALLMIFVPVLEGAGAPVTRSRSPWRHFADTMRDHQRVLASAGAAQLFAQMIRAARPVIIPLFGKEVLGLDVRQVGYIISVASGIDMTLFYPAGWMMDRWGRKFAILPCFFIQAIGMALVPFTTGFGGLLAATALIGFGNGLGSGTMMTLGADLAPPDARGEFLGVWRLIGDSGGTGAPMIVGGVAELVGLQVGAWVMSGAGVISVLLFAFLVPETLKEPLILKHIPTAISNRLNGRN